MKSNKIVQYPKKHIFITIIFVMILVNVLLAYHRFIIKKDYRISYEGVCDPVSNICFIGCDDEGCTKSHFYSKMEKYTPDLLGQCGRDITDCEAANKCLEGDRDCSITYCDLATPIGEGDQCETINDQAQLDPFQQTTGADKNNL